MVWNQGWQAAQVLSGRDFLKAVLALVLLLGVMAAGGRDLPQMAPPSMCRRQGVESEIGVTLHVPKLQVWTLAARRYSVFMFGKLIYLSGGAKWPQMAPPSMCRRQGVES